MNTKRMLSLILAISMIMTSFMAVCADETAETAAEEVETVTAVTEDDPYYRAVTVLKALGIMEGKSEENFGADDYLTRAEVSTIAIRFLGLDAASKTGVADSGYTDVANDHWAKYYIDMASALGIIHGNGDGTFEPDSEITAEQAIKIMVCAMGYEPKAETLGEYPASYLTVASSLGLLRGINFSEGTAAPIPRWQIATLVYNALDKDLMDVIVYGENNYSIVTEDMTALGVYHKVAKSSGTVTATYESAFEDGYRVEGDVRIDDTDYVTELEMHSYLGQYVDFYYIIPEGSEKGEIIAVFTAEKTEGTEISFDDLYTINVTESFGVEIEYYTEDGTKLKRMSLANPIIMYNGKVEEFADAAAAQAFLDANMNQGQLIVQNNSKNDFQDVLFVENYDAYVVQRVDAQSEKIFFNTYDVNKVEVAELELSNKDNPERKVIIYGDDGAEITVGDLVKDDVIMVYASTDKMLYKIQQSKKQVTGIINRRDTIPGTAPDPDEIPRPEIKPEPKPYWEVVSEFNIDGFKHKSSSAYSAVYEKTVNSGTEDEHVITFEASGEDTAIGGRTYVMSVDDAISQMGVNTAMRDGKPDVVGIDVFPLNRNWRTTPYGDTVQPGANTSLRPKNIFDMDKVEIGDQLKVTVWVYPSNAYEWDRNRPKDKGQPVKNVTADMTTRTRAWLSVAGTKEDNWEGYQGKWPDEKNKADEHTAMMLPFEKWSELTFTYDVTEQHKTGNVASLRIDNSNVDTVFYYPLTLFVGAVRVERYVDPTIGMEEVIEPRPDVWLNPTEYDVYIDGVEYKAVSNFPTSQLEMNKTVTLLLDKNDKIVGFKRAVQKEGYGMLMDVGVEHGAFGSILKVKILGSDNVITTYDTLEEIEAWDGTMVKKLPAVSLVTDEPADPMKSHYLWSYNNAENFEMIPRTWLTDEAKSNAASRKLVYFETNAKGQIKKILVPAMPENDPDAKIVMIKDFEYSEEDKNKGVMKHSYWPGILTHAYRTGRLEPEYHFPRGIPKFCVWAEDYDEDDYSAQTGEIWEDNAWHGRQFDYMQLYRMPGSKTVDFFVANTSHASTISRLNNDWMSYPIIVKSIEDTGDGYILNGYNPKLQVNTNNSYSQKIKKDIRLFESIWMAEQPNSNGTRITWDNIMNYIGTLPYKCSYEALGMENPYVSPESIHPGDFIRVVEENGEINYVEMIRRVDVAIPSAYQYSYYTNIDGFFGKDSYCYGEVTDINAETGVVKIRGFYWYHPTSTISTELYTQATNNTDYYIAELEVPFFASQNLTIWDEEKQEYQVGTFPDFEVGDLIFVLGSLEWPRSATIYKNHNK